MTASEKKQLMAAACRVRMASLRGPMSKAGHPAEFCPPPDLFTYLYF